MDDTRLARFGQFTPEGVLTPGYGDHYLFLVGRDDVHGILHMLLTSETMGLKLNMFGYDDEELNDDILFLMQNKNVAVQGSLDKTQAGGVHEKRILAADVVADPEFYNSFVILESETDQISHTKAGVLVAQGLAFESSVNWSGSGEGTGISLKPGAPQPAGFKAQNNTFVVTANPVFISRLAARLDVEHLQGLAKRAVVKIKAPTLTASATVGLPPLPGHV